MSSFKDSELIGISLTESTVGKIINDGLVEFKVRETGESETLKPEEAFEKITEILKPYIK